MIESPSKQTSLPSRRVQFGPFEVDLYTKELRKHGTRIKLAGQPFQVLATLLSRPGDLVTREELQQTLWSEDTFGDSNHGLNAAVNKLRETLNDNANDPKYIETLPRRGYRFIGVINTEAPSGKKQPMAAQQTTAPQRMQPLPPLPLAPPPVVMAVARRPLLTSQRLATITATLLVAIGILAMIGRDQNQVGASAPAPESSNAGSVYPQVSLEPVAEQTMKVDPEDVSRKAVSEKAEVATPPVFREASTSTAAATMRTIISGNGGNAAPQFSPDGGRIAFMSDRSGPWQIWVSNIDGTNPVQLSYTDSAGTPRWSPDGKLIAFDAPSEDGTSIFVIPSNGSAPARHLIQGQVPSFSRDGRSVYFASDRSGGMQVWKIPVAGGSPQQVTTGGGFAALESSDGYLYYTKSPGNGPEICRVAVSGGDENCTLPHLRPRTWSSWAVTRNGIVFAEDLPGGKAALSVYEPQKREVRDLVWLPSPPVWMGARPDGSEVIVNDSAERQISVVQNLR